MYPTYTDDDLTERPSDHYHDCWKCHKLVDAPCGDNSGMCMAPWRKPWTCDRCEKLSP